ncbi:MAG: hypothetical protein ACAI38_12810 [Myxococcota bacterium]|nr:hypothetical protein [Myxococcota bacterium]
MKIMNFLVFLLLATMTGASVNAQVVSQREQNGAQVTEVAFDSAGHRVQATVIEPRNKSGKLAGVVYANDAADAGQVFANEALILASRGTVSVIIALPKEADESQRVSAVQRALDLAVEHGAAQTRLAYVGCGEGRALAAPLATADTRVKSYVLHGGSSAAAAPSGTQVLVQDGKTDVDARRERVQFLTSSLKPH